MRRLRKHAKSSSAFFAMSNSLIFTLPEVGRSSPPSRWSSVDLPTPDSPVTATISPRATSRLSSRKTTTSSARPEYILVRSTARSKTSPFLRMFSNVILIQPQSHRATETKRARDVGKTYSDVSSSPHLSFPLSLHLSFPLSLFLCVSAPLWQNPYLLSGPAFIKPSASETTNGRLPNGECDST